MSGRRDAGALGRPGRARLIVSTAAAAILGAALYGGVAGAMHDTNTIHACVHKQTGIVRIVDDPDECKQSETAVEWSVEGPVGPPGPQGPPGPKGDPGGLSGYELVTSESVTVGPGGEPLGEFAVCPAGKVATGGGHQVIAQSDPEGIPVGGVPLALVESYPVKGPPSGWVVIMRSDKETASFTFIVRAVCVDG
jgi:hypothetical protein